jgi:hypothetical protein
MPEAPDTRMIVFHVPEEGKILEALGAIALLHTHLDRALQLTIKSLTGITVRQAVDATAYEGSRTLKGRVRKLARMRLGEGTALVKLQALMRQCERATERRNDLVHGI